MKFHSVPSVPIAYPPRLRVKIKQISLYLGTLLIFSLILAPWVQASTGGLLSRGQAYALGGLGLITLSLFVYLFIVILQPEKF